MSLAISYQEIYCAQDRTHAARIARKQQNKFGRLGETNGWEAIPEDLLIIILKHGDKGMALNCRLVCKRWNFVTNQSLEV